MLGINPFDQPNVQESKDNTVRLLADHAATGRLPVAEAAPAVTARLEREHADRRIGDMLADARERYPVEILDWNLPFLLDVGDSSEAETSADS